MTRSDLAEWCVTVTEKAPHTDPEGNCPFCGRTPENPRKVVRDGALYECCVGEAHDPYIVPNSNHSAFVARARKAGLDGAW